MYLNCIYVSQDIAENTFYYILVYSILNRGIERWLESYNIDELSMAKYSRITCSGFLTLPASVFFGEEVPALTTGNSTRWGRKCTVLVTISNY